MGEIASNIKAAMDERGMKAIQLSEATGISRSRISCYLNGKYVPKTEALMKIAKALGVSVAWLIGGDEECELVSIYRRLDRRGKASLLNCAVSILEAMENESGKDEIG